MTLTEIGFAYRHLWCLSSRKAWFCLMLHYQTSNLGLKTPIPCESVRAFAVLTGPIPPELTADTLMTYMV